MNPSPRFAKCAPSARTLGRLTCLLAVVPGLLVAQTQPAALTTPTGQDEIPVVALDPFKVTTSTGSVQPQSRMESALAITKLDPGMIQQSGARTLVEVLRAIPGFYFEPSAGEVGGPVATRGIGAGQSLGRYAAVLEDGMPVISEQSGSFIAADLYTRNSLWISGVEGLRGGSSGVFTSNAPLGSINFVGREGTPAYHGEYKIEVGDYGLIRNDLWVAGPLSPHTTFAVGALYRVSDGIRDPGYKADRGGLVNFNVRHQLPNDKGHLKLSFKGIDDRTASYFPLPLTGSISDPQTIPGGPDINSGATTSSDMRHLTLPNSPMGPINWDLANGSWNKMHRADAELELRLTDSLKVQNRTRFTSVDRSSTLHAFGTTTTLQSIANSLAASNVVPASTWAAARLADGNYNFRLTLPGQNGAVAAANPAAAATLNGNGLGNLTGYWMSAAEVDDFQNDLRLTATLNDARTSLTAALYVKSYKEMRLWQQNQELIGISPDFKRLDLTFLDATTNTAIGTYTYNGISRAGTLYRHGTAEAEEVSPYVNLTHKMGAFSLDAGARFMDFEYAGETEGTRAYDLNSYTQTSGIAALSSATFGTGNYTTASAAGRKTAFTAGLNYEFSPQFAAFGRYSNGPRMPNGGDLVIANGVGNVTPRAVENLVQYELGLKYGTSKLAVFVTAFFTQQRDVIANGLVLDQNGNTVQQSFNFGLDVPGIELETTWAPVRGLTIDLRGAVQRPEYVSPQRVNVATAASPVYVAIDGLQPTRTPKLYGSLNASYTFPEFSWGRLTANASYSYTGDRPGNQQALPERAILSSFDEVGLGASLAFKNSFVLRLQVANLFNGTGITEFDPRLAAGSITIPPYFNARPLLPRTIVSSLTYKF